MIHTIRTVAVEDQESKIDSPIILYRGDREVEVEFTINGSKFTFTNGGNVIKSTNATHGQLVINTPTGENMFSEVTECHDGKVVFVITKEMIDELIEVGFYSFQIRLFDESQVSRVTIPPVLKGIDIRNPIAAEDETNLVDIGLVDYAVVVKDEFEDLSTFLPDGNYNKTEWESKDVISGAKLNKIEDALYNINYNMEATDLALLNRVENINVNIHNEIAKMGHELNSEVKKFKTDVDIEVSNMEKEIEDINEQTLAHETKMLKKENKNKLSYKKIAYELPLIFPDYYYTVEFNSCVYNYPQSFAIDDDNIYILYSPDETTKLGNRWIAVYNKNSEYLGCFSAGLSGGEGLEIISKGYKKYLYAKGKGTQLYKYDISVMPSNRDVLSPIDTFSVGLYYDFSYYKGTWLIEQSGTSLGSKVRRNVFGIFDDNFNSLGYTTVNLKDVGLWKSSDAYYSKMPKRQGVSLCGNVIYQATGGYWGRELDTVDPASYQGIRVFNLDGNLKEETLLDPSKMRRKLISLGVNCTRIEYEGVKFFDDKLYSMVATLGRFDTLASTGGLLIFEEMSEEGINFDDCKVPYTSIDSTRLQIGIYPRAGDGNLYDFITGEKLTSINGIIRYMSEIDLMSFSFYSSAVSIIDLNGSTIPTGILVTIKNVNNTTFFMDYQGDHGNVMKFIIYQADGVYKQKKLSTHTTDELTLLNGASLFYNNRPVIIKSDVDVVTISGYITNVYTGMIIGNLPEQYRPRHNMPFVVALSASSYGGYGVIFIKTTGDIELVYQSMDTEYIAINATYTI